MRRSQSFRLRPRYWKGFPLRTSRSCHTNWGWPHSARAALALRRRQDHLCREQTTEVVQQRTGARAPRTLIDDSKPMWQALAVFLVPLILSNVLQSANATMNSIFLGRMVGVYSLAAASAFFPMLFLLISFVIGISSGSTVLIGQAFGAGNHKRMNQVAGTTLSLVLILSAIV